jgi:2-C-methyl-D-erythritol 2,4-cyclodiphosphate synthase
VARRGGRIVNVDTTVIAQAPKIYPHIAEMKKHIAAALGMAEEKIGVKATTNELMGFIGREEGIAAMAVASINLPE